MYQTGPAMQGLLYVVIDRTLTELSENRPFNVMLWSEQISTSVITTESRHMAMCYFERGLWKDSIICWLNHHTLGGLCRKILLHIFDESPDF